MRGLLGVSVGWLGISLVADSVPSVLLPYRVAQEGGTATQLGLITLVAIALSALVQPAAGTLSDRRGRMPVVIAGAVIAAGGLAALAIGDAAVGTVITLVGVGIAQAGYQALMPERVAAGYRGRAAGAKGFFDVGGAFVGFLLVGTLLSAGDDGGAVAIVLAIALSGCLVVGVLLASRPQRGPTETAMAVEEHPGLPVSLVRLTVARFLFLLGIYAVGRFLLLFVADRLGRSAEVAAADAGAALAVLAFLTALAALPAGWLGDRLGRRPLMLGGGAIAAIGVAGLPLASSLPSIVAMGTLMAVGTAAFGAGSWAALADVSAGPHAGRRLGLASLGTAGAAAAAGLFGPLIDAAETVAPGAGFSVAFSLAALAVVAGALVAGVIPSPPELARIEVRE